MKYSYPTDMNFVNVNIFYIGSYLTVIIIINIIIIEF